MNKAVIFPIFRSWPFSCPSSLEACLDPRGMGQTLIWPYLKFVGRKLRAEKTSGYLLSTKKIATLRLQRWDPLGPPLGRWSLVLFVLFLNFCVKTFYLFFGNFLVIRLELHLGIRSEIFTEIHSHK